jgi:putative transposase
VRPITELEDYAVDKRVAPSVELEAAIERLLTGGLAEGLTDAERLAEIGRLGARLALQRGVEDEVDAFLGRTRYERTPEARGWRNGNRARQVQTAEGELEIQVPQIRGAAEKFVSSVIPNGRTALRTRPLEALIIGAWVRGLSDRDIESLVEEAGLGQLSKSAVSEITKELRARYKAFRARSLAEHRMLVLFCDAIYLPTRPSGAKEGVLVAFSNELHGEAGGRGVGGAGACRHFSEGSVLAALMVRSRLPAERECGRPDAPH